ncbi:MAG: sigma-54-dependent Fis family transcriptional regulator [Candidatus Puniceispirillum sp.]|nr:sigma-54-dependent Fis family transcriptional regulator [Candidatus Pelagibacter sp.]MBA4282875.1 sigma-54-dependent Fis family transcriptional regulator [Candidatus Puniceispirillum sp.]
MKILIIGTLNGHGTVAAHIALKMGAKVTQVNNSEEALNVLRSGKGIDLIMMDILLNIPHMMENMTRERICTPVVACGVKSNPQLAKEAIESGAKEYIPLPPDPELIAAVIKAISQEETYFIAEDPSMKTIIKMIDKIAPTEANIFINGESGTGKEVVAKYIHMNSKRKDRNFVSINCAAIPEQLLESELFGHEKGAFTGAIARRIGKFEEANGGTLLLDEISEMDPRLQAKMLRAIQERVIDRVGGTHPVPVDIRILATSNRNMEEAIANKEFREDLYYRLNVVNVALPPLRERIQDILPLTEYFIKKFCDLNGLPIKKLSPESAECICNYGWKGNVRELENTIHRAVLLSEQEIQPIDIFGQSYLQTINYPYTTSENNNSENININPFIGKSVSEVEKDLILGTLTHCLGNRTHAANILGISIRTLRNKIKEYKSDEIHHDQTAYSNIK